jgi:hypothetical protein
MYSDATLTTSAGPSRLPAALQNIRDDHWVWDDAGKWIPDPAYVAEGDIVLMAGENGQDTLWPYGHRAVNQGTYLIIDYDPNDIPVPVLIATDDTRYPFTLVADADDGITADGYRWFRKHEATLPVQVTKRDGSKRARHPQNKDEWKACVDEYFTYI